MKLRKTIIAVHRDVGYFFAGLTVLYAISGVAVNHIGHWNPSYTVTNQTHELGRQFEGESDDDVVDVVLAELNIEEQPKASVRMSEDQLRIFLQDRTLNVALSTGQVADEHVKRRVGFFEVNYLHLNHGKGLWTWFADLYAIGLLVLALTGIFIITGKKGLGGRGRWLLLAGILIPVFYLVLKL